MLYRDDVYQANRRVEDLEAQLIEARSNRDHLAPVATAPRRVEAVDTPEAYEWWPVLLMMTSVVLYFAYFRVRMDDFDLPLDVLVPSAIFGSALYSLDVVMRRLNGNHRTAWCRLAMALGAIVAIPVLLMGFLLFGGLMGVVGPILAVIVVVGSLVHWIARGG